MKQENNKTKLHIRSTEEWKELTERYFEAQTTDEEERQLRHFLVTEAAAGKEFDEVRAVMGFLTVGKSLRQPKKSYHLPVYSMKWVAVVVVFCVMGSAAWKIVDRSQNVCVAYIYGEKCTDTEVVMSQLKNSLHQVQRGEEDVTVEEQLNDMFQTLESEDITTLNEK